MTIVLLIFVVYQGTLDLICYNSNTVWKKSKLFMNFRLQNSYVDMETMSN